MESESRFDFFKRFGLRIAQLRCPTALPAVGLLIAVSTQAQAVDGCQVLLCLAAPSWRSIPQCVPTINQLMRDLAHGRPFPICDMPGAGNSANHTWASAPNYCPLQYTRIRDGANGPTYVCEFSGAVSVLVNGELFTRTWWNDTGDTVTDFSPTAKAQLGTWDPRFDNDYAAWVATLPPPPTPTDTGN